MFVPDTRRWTPFPHRPANQVTGESGGSYKHRRDRGPSNDDSDTMQGVHIKPASEPCFIDSTASAILPKVSLRHEEQDYTGKKLKMSKKVQTVRSPRARFEAASHERRERERSREQATTEWMKDWRVRRQREEMSCNGSIARVVSRPVVRTHATYIHTCMHACIHTYIHTCIHTCIHTNTHAYSYKQTYIYTLLQGISYTCYIHTNDIYVHTHFSRSLYVYIYIHTQTDRITWAELE